MEVLIILGSNGEPDGGEYKQKGDGERLQAVKGEEIKAYEVIQEECGNDVHLSALGRSLGTGMRV